MGLVFPSRKALNFFRNFSEFFRSNNLRLPSLVSALILLRGQSHCAGGGFEVLAYKFLEEIESNLNNEDTFSSEIWTQSRHDH